VVEACSGLRYLIASFTLGCLYAYLSYRSLKYRLVFVALSVVVPIIANGLRAYAIVIIGHLSNMKLAVGVDHLVYGWLFFGFVMLLLFWAGSFWREDFDARSSADALASPVSSGESNRGLAAVVLGTLLVAAMWPAYGYRVDALVETVAMPHLTVPEVPGWTVVEEKGPHFVPRYLRPRASIHQWYMRDGKRVGLYVAYYNQQTDDVKLVSSQNTIVVSNDETWSAVGTGARGLRFAGASIKVNETQLRSRDMSRLLTYDWYWTGGEFTNNPYRAKALEAASRLLGRGDDGAVIVVFTPYDERPAPAAATLQSFLQDALPAIQGTLANARRN
jgi:EpsI family protein